MQVQINVQRRFLRAALVTAAKADIRYYLNGVLFEVSSGNAFIVSTDGHRLSVFRDNDAGCTELGDAVEQFIVPDTALKAIKAHKTIASVILVYDTDTKRVTIRDFAASGETSVQVIDGKFPDWRRVVPLKPSGAAAQYNVEYVGDLAAIAKALGKEPHAAYVIPGGKGSALTLIPGVPEYIGVLMPMRGEPELPDVSAFKETGRAAPLKKAA